MYCKLWAKENPGSHKSRRGKTPPQWGPLHSESQIRLNPTKVGNTTSRLAHPHRPGSCSSGPRRSVPTFCPQSAHKTPKNHAFQHNTQTAAIRTSKPNTPDLRTAQKHHNENHDFFSGSGSSYVIGKAESTEDDDWDF